MVIGDISMTISWAVVSSRTVNACAALRADAKTIDADGSASTSNERGTRKAMRKRVLCKRVAGEVTRKRVLRKRVTGEPDMRIS
jgi:hypothetical protein